MAQLNLETRFSVGRIALLMRNRLYDDLPAMAITAGGIVAVNILTIIAGATPFFNNALGRGSLWSLAIALGGILLAGNAFGKMHDGRSGPDWVLLPASSEEKYLSALIAYLPVYLVAAALTATALSAALAGIGILVGTGGGIIWNPLSPRLLEGVEIYLSFSLVALVGSARFRKFALGKTAAVLFAAGIASSLILVGVLLLVTDEGRAALFAR